MASPDDPSPFRPSGAYANGNANAFFPLSLAILGEGSVLANAQVTFLSYFCYLPRLLPAPQAFIRPTRPDRLETVPAEVVGAASGNVRHHLNHVANILHDEGNSLPDFSVRCYTLTEKESPPVRAKLAGPLTWLAVLGCAMSVALLVLAIAEDDGMAMLATVLLSSLSSILGFGSKWTLKLPRRIATRPVPPGDVVIKYPQGAFVIIKCSEEIARELYWAPEQCNYQRSLQSYRLISLIGTLMLMFGVIALGNAGVTLQIAFAAAYLILNAGYWAVAALPAKMHWDLGSFEKSVRGSSTGEANANFTQALWQAIAITRSSEWARIAGIAPRSRAWDEWLGKAAEMACFEGEREGDGYGNGNGGEKGDVIRIPDWDCQASLSEFMNPGNAVRNV